MRNTLLFSKQTPNIAPHKSCAGAAGRLKRSQGGMTLVEVLVAMFVLAVGVLALLATQLRTVSSVREAESQTIVAQAVQNLIEGMQLNPTLSAATGANAGNTGWTRKRYDDMSARAPGSSGPLSYRNAGPVRRCSDSSRAWYKPDTSTALNKRQLLEDHLCRFENSLFNALPNTDIRYVICNDTSNNEMTVNNGTVNNNCTGKDGDPLVVKVLWQIDNEKQAEGALKSNGSKLVYTYQARIPD